MTTDATTYEGELRVFSAADNMEWVIARDPEDAAAVWLEHAGGEPSYWTALGWTECDPARAFTWHDEDGGEDIKTTYGELAKRGRGYLASANW